MAEIDPVILELRAEMNKARVEIKQYADQTERNFTRVERSTQRLEKQMLNSSTAIAGTFRTLAGTLGTLFTGRELVGLLDSFTRMQNSIRIAGNEGEQLKVTQDRLFATAQRYGVELEGLASLYSTTAQAAKGFGAAQEQVFKVTDATSAALKITGQTSQQAAGALLQLGQAFRSPKVQAEEFNSLIDGLYPLLEAAAKGSDRWRGNVNKLIADVKKGTVAGQEFFNAVAAGADILEKRAAKATLTLAAGMTTLTNALTVYFGEADKANGVSAALGYALNALADNIDTIIPALAAIIAILGVQYVAAAARAIAANVALTASTTGAAGAMGVLGAASFALQARMVGAATSMEAAAFAARGLGGSLLALAGGPYGALIALGAGLAYVIATTDDAAQASGQYRRQQEALKEIQEKTKAVTEQLAAATGKARREALANAKALREETKQYLANAQAALIAAAAKASETRQRAVAAASQASGGGPGEGVQGRVSSSQERFNRARRDAIQADANAKAAEANVISAQKEIARLTKIIDAAAPPPVSAVGDGGGKKKSRSSGSSGPSPAEIEARFNQELANLAQQTLAARQQMATSAEERAELELRSVELARVAALDSLKAEKDYSAAQKARVADAIENLAEIERARIERERRLQVEEDRAQIVEAEARAQADALRDQYDLALTLEERRRIALEIIDLEDRARLEALRRVQMEEDLYDAKTRQLAAIEEAAIIESRNARVERARRADQGPLDRYIEGMADPKTRAEEAAVRQLQAVNDGITDALTDKLGIKNQFVKDMLSIFLDRVLFQPLAEALQNGGGGGGGFGSFISSVAGAIFGRASGGHVAAGQLVRINEGASPGRVEGWRPDGGGTVIPLGQMNQAAARPSGGQSGPLEVRLYADEGTFISRVTSISQGEAVKVTMEAAPSIISASARETKRQLSRPRMPGAGR